VGLFSKGCWLKSLREGSVLISCTCLISLAASEGSFFGVIGSFETGAVAVSEGFGSGVVSAAISFFF